MSVRPIRESGDPVLREISVAIAPEEFGSTELQQLLADMADTLDGQSDGVALAAPQIGVGKRLFIVRYDRMKEKAPVEDYAGPVVGVFINPEIVKSSRRRDEVQEGCLSVRGIYGTTLRHERATVRAQDEQGTWFTRGGGGILAQAYQHEIDHLDGVLFTDHALETHEQTREEAEHAVQPA